MADLNASRRFAAHADGVLQVQNVANFYRNDATSFGAAIGRQTKIGMRLRF